MDAHRISIAVALVLAASNVAAEVVYVDPPDTVVTLTTQCGNLLELDLDGNGQWDYSLFGCFEEDLGYWYVGFWGGGENWVAGEGGLLRGFQEGETIRFESTSWESIGRLLTSRGDGAWAGGEMLFLGFFLREGGPSEVLGWIRLRALAPPVEGGLSLIVYDYAYENERRREIRAGRGTIAVRPVSWSAIKRLYTAR